MARVRADITQSVSRRFIPAALASTDACGAFPARELPGRAGAGHRVARCDGDAARDAETYGGTGTGVRGTGIRALRSIARSRPLKQRQPKAGTVSPATRARRRRQGHPGWSIASCRPGRRTDRQAPSSDVTRDRRCIARSGPDPHSPHDAGPRAEPVDRPRCRRVRPPRCQPATATAGAGSSLRRALLRRGAGPRRSVQHPVPCVPAAGGFRHARDWPERDVAPPERAPAVR